jgi:hypothetical protein
MKYFVLLLLGISLGIVKYNKYEIEPTHQGLYYLNQAFGDIKINDSADIIKVQNKVIEEIDHQFLSSDQIHITNNIKFKKGLCYDRSLILQKILLFSNLDIRPVYVFLKTIIQHIGTTFLIQN